MGRIRTGSIRATVSRFRLLMNRDYFLADERAKLKPHLPTATGGKPGVDARRLVRGMIHASGAAGKVDTPCGYSPRKTLCNRFKRWAPRGATSFMPSCGWTPGPASHRFFGRACASFARQGVKGNAIMHRSITRRPVAL